MIKSVTLTINWEFLVQMNVLNIMSLIVDKMSEDMGGHIENLIKYLPMLWEESASHNMLRAAIVTTLVREN